MDIQTEEKTDKRNIQYNNNVSIVAKTTADVGDRGASGDERASCGLLEMTTRSCRRPLGVR